MLNLVSCININNISQIPSTSHPATLFSNVFMEKTQNQFNFRCPTLSFTQNLNNNDINNTNLLHNNKNEISRSESILYYRTLFKHFVIYSNQLLPSLFSIYASFKNQKMIVDFQKQASCMLNLCNHVSSLFPNSGTIIQRNCFKIFKKIAKCNLIGNFKFFLKNTLKNKK